jgi:hypothetical protein
MPYLRASLFYSVKRVSLLFLYNSKTDKKHASREIYREVEENGKENGGFVLELI